jgi:hypothetical protein
MASEMPWMASRRPPMVACRRAKAFFSTVSPTHRPAPFCSQSVERPSLRRGPVEIEQNLKKDETHGDPSVRRRGLNHSAAGKSTYAEVVQSCLDPLGSTNRGSSPSSSGVSNPPSPADPKIFQPIREVHKFHPEIASRSAPIQILTNLHHFPDPCPAQGQSAHPAVLNLGGRNHNIQCHSLLWKMMKRPTFSGGVIW